MSLIEIKPTRSRPDDAQQPYAHDLERDLKKKIEGEVRFSDGDRALYSTDGSNYRQVPIGVVVPRSYGDVIETLAACRKYGAPVFGRGGGTSLAGQCCNIGVVMDFSKYLNKILEIEPFEKYARIQPGLVLDTLRHEANKWELTYGPDPATHNHCTLGGMIGNNSCGIHALMAGKTEENIEELDVITYDGLRMRVGKTSDEELDQIIHEGGRRGEIYAAMKRIRDRYGDLVRQRYPKIPRRVSGYNLNELLPENGFHVARALVGTESTCCIWLEAKVRLVWNPPARTLVVLGYPDAFQAADHVMEILEFKPIGLEGVDDMLISDMKKKGLHPKDLKLLPEGNGWLLVEFGAETKQESDAKARQMMEALKKEKQAPSMKLYDDEKEEALVWEIRESGLGATAFVPGQHVTWEGWEDSAVSPENLGRYLRDLKALYDKFHYQGALYGHFGQGCVHTRITFDFKTVEGIRTYRRFMEEATDLVIKHGGVYSGEHGDGQSKAEFLPKLYGEEMVDAFREFKRAWDPDWKMNPGKIVDPYRVDENLRIGADYHPNELNTHFSYKDYDHRFALAAERCVGVGECRRHHGKTMCPSYRVTLEEKHSTRGRARLLFEMVQGEVIKDGWRSEAVKEALDLCLACKGCKGDCPVNVDMATYKAEFLSHYYENRLRPMSAYSMGLIYWWARIASFAPRIANVIMQTPGLSEFIKLTGGIASERTLPKFANQPFKQWFGARSRRNVDKPGVILWPDTFNNYFHPNVAQAAVEVIEDAGYRVLVPKASLCCGRPLYDFGMLDTARRMLEQIIATLRPAIRRGTPVIGLEPSCVTVFRDELPDLMPNDEDAMRLSEQTFTLAEFLDKKASHYEIPKLHRKATVHGHCHQKAIMKMKSEEHILAKTGLDYNLLQNGCCGMAGSFGFERDHYEISMKVFEHELAPHLREAEPETLILADGFSCRTQIEQAAGRHAMHLAEALQMAIREERGDQHPVIARSRAADPRLVAATGAAGLLIGGSLLWGVQHRRSQRESW
jgi:FAD/FMN-containing dehydrogenase/Fe-S oxidoreductase